MNCNLSCLYCKRAAEKEIGSFHHDFDVDLVLPNEFFQLTALKKFLEKDPQPVLVFYGGEPLLAVSKIQWIMDHVRAEFILQTNGTLLDRLSTDYLSRLRMLIVSLDGRRETTNFFRGRGTFDRVVFNLKRISDDVDIELVARMTVMEPVDLYAEVKWLFGNLPLDGVHWQLNAGFYADFKERAQAFVPWLKGSYLPSLEKLIDWWIREMEKGRVLRIYPFLGIVNSLLNKERNWLMCGAGHSNYSIQTDGKIIPCPQMIGLRDFYLGSISESDPTQLPKVFPSGRCMNCAFEPLCGGRCLYSLVMQKWGKEYELVCEASRFLIRSILSRMGKIRHLLNSGVISKRDFEYPKYCTLEIIP